MTSLDFTMISWSPLVKKTRRATPFSSSVPTNENGSGGATGLTGGGGGGGGGAGGGGGNQECGRKMSFSFKDEIMARSGFWREVSLAKTFKRTRELLAWLDPREVPPAPPR